MRSLLYILLLLTLSGCAYSGSKFTHGLDEAEAMLQSDPLSAIERLNGFDIAEFNDSAILARWALLYSEAMIANNISAPTDTIVNIAIRYYGDHNLTEQFNHASRLKALLSTGATDKLGAALYLQKEKEYQLYREQVKFRQMIMCVAILLLASLVVIIRLYSRLRLRKAENESLMSTLDYNRRARVQADSELAGILNSRFRVIDELCETYYETQGTASERNAICNRVKAQINAIRTDEAMLSEMEQTVNRCRNNILQVLKTALPDISRPDYLLAIYLSCNLSNRTISLLVGKDVDVIYKRKSRLKAKINASESDRKDLLMTLF